METTLLQLIETANANLLDSALTPLQIIGSLSVTLLIALFIFFIYRTTYRGALYSKSFNITLIMTALIVNAIMIGINGSIVLSLGMVGALSVIRFRTAVKDPKDTAFLFWAVAIGVINGVTYYALSIIATIFISLILIAATFMKQRSENYVLILHRTGGVDHDVEMLLQSSFQKLSVKTQSYKKDQVEEIVEVANPKKATSEILEDLTQLPSVLNCTLLAHEGEVSE